MWKYVLKSCQGKTVLEKLHNLIIDQNSITHQFYHIFDIQLCKYIQVFSFFASWRLPFYCSRLFLDMRAIQRLQLQQNILSRWRRLYDELGHTYISIKIQLWSIDSCYGDQMHTNFYSNQVNIFWAIRHQIESPIIIFNTP